MGEVDWNRGGEGGAKTAQMPIFFFEDLGAGFLTDHLSFFVVLVLIFQSNLYHIRGCPSSTVAIAARRTAACWHKESKRDQRRAKRREPKDQDQSRKPHQLLFRGSMIHERAIFPEATGRDAIAKG